MLASYAAHATQLVAIVHEIAGDALMQKAERLARFCPSSALAVFCGMTDGAMIIGGTLAVRAFSPAVEQ